MTDAPAFPTRISYAEARAILETIGHDRRQFAQKRPLSRAHGAVIAQNLFAPIPLPSFDNSAMDGFALRHADLATGGPTTLRLVAEQFAGVAVADLDVAAGTCVRITTGAPVPTHADTVVMKEDTLLEGDTVTVLRAPARGQHVRRAGEDAAVGDQVLRIGDVLTPSRVALASSLGFPELEVAQRPTVAVFTTGDELVEPGIELERGQVYNSNREQLMGLLRADGLEPVAWPTLPDDAAASASALRHAGHAFDLVITCGAVSAGEKDHLPAILRAEGQVHFWKVLMKPGMPVLFASGGSLGPALFLCLPGNPVSVLATYLTLARPLLDALQTRTQPRPVYRAQLSTAWRKKNARLEFLRGRLSSRDDGMLVVEPNPADGSHRMRAAADSDALIEMAEGERDYAAGDVVAVHPY